MSSREVIKRAIIKANKYGAEGIHVVDYMEPIHATQSPELVLIIHHPKPSTVSELVPYDDQERRYKAV